MVTALAVIGILLCLAGLAEMTTATLGVGLICAACFLGILARLWQATNTEELFLTRSQKIIEELEALKKQ